MAQGDMRALVLVVCLILANPANADIPRPDSLSDTLTLLHGAIRDAGFPDAAIDAKNNSVVTNPGSEDSFITYPDNLHRSLQNAASDAERQIILDGFIAPLLQGFDTQEAFAPERVMPILRPVDYLDGLGEGAQVQTRPFAGNLMVTYVLDYPTHTTSIAPDTMKAAGYDADGLHALAMENLRTAAANLSVESSDVGISFLALDGYYENAMLLDAQLWDNITRQIGPVAVTVPARDFVMIAPRADRAAVKLMTDIRDQALQESPYPISGQTFTWNGGSWSVLPE